MDKQDSQLQQLFARMEQSLSGIEQYSSHHPKTAKGLHAWWFNEMSEAIESVIERVDRLRRRGGVWPMLPVILEEDRDPTSMSPHDTV